MPESPSVTRFTSRPSFSGTQPSTAGGNVPDVDAEAPPPPGIRPDETLIAPPDSRPLPHADVNGGRDYDPVSTPASYGAKEKTGGSTARRVLLTGGVVALGVGGTLAFTGHLPMQHHSVPVISAPASPAQSAPPPAQSSTTPATAPAPATPAAPQSGTTINGVTYSDANAPAPAAPSYSPSTQSWNNNWMMNSQAFTTFQDGAYNASPSTVSNLATQFANSAANPAGVWVRGLNPANPQQVVHVTHQEMLTDAAQNGPLTQALFGPQHSPNIVVGASADSPTVTTILLN